MKRPSTRDFIAQRNSCERPYEIYSDGSLRSKLACHGLSIPTRDKIEQELKLRQSSKPRRSNTL